MTSPEIPTGPAEGSSPVPPFDSAQTGSTDSRLGNGAVWPSNESGDSGPGPVPGDHPPEQASTVSGSTRRRAYPEVAWAVILLASGVIAFLNSGLGGGQSGRAGAVNAVQDMQNRYLIGSLQWMPDPLNRRSIIDTQFATGDAQQVLATTLLLAETQGAEVALQELDSRTANLTLTEAQQAARESLRQLFQQQVAKTLNQPGAFPPEQREVLEREFGWLGRLGLNPREGGDPEVRQQLLSEANRTLGTMVGAFGGAVCAGSLGLGLLVLFVVCAVQNRLSFRLQLGSGTGGYYVEMFAIWFVVFFAFNLGTGAVVPQSVRVGAAGIASLLSLVTLGWPVLRGIPWSQVRRELGLVWPRSGLVDAGLGVVAYIGALPAVLIGMVGTLIVMRLMGALAELAVPLADVPAHPIVELFARGTAFEKFQAVAVVLLVPITEEIMFRGALYRHLREGSSRLQWLSSLAFALVTSAFLFAVIHPQGIAGVPLLMSIAVVLGVLREWRGSLVTPIVTHMVVNGVTTSVALLAFS